MKLKKTNLLSPQRNIKIIKMAHKSPQQEQILTQFTKERIQKKMWLRKTIHILFTQKKDLNSQQNREITNIPRKS